MKRGNTRYIIDPIAQQGQMHLSVTGKLCALGASDAYLKGNSNVSLLC